MIRVLICDDQDVVREGLRAILRGAPGIEVVGTATDGSEALEAIGKIHPDVVLMDLKMPVMNGIQATREIIRNHAGVRVLVLTTYDADEWLFDALRAGASGYLLKDSSRAELVTAISGTAAGKTHLDPAVAGKVVARAAGGTTAGTTLAVDLSARERDVLRLLGHGLSNAEIAARLALSEGTVRNYMTIIFEKLGVEDRTQAALLAARHGLADPG